MSFDGQLSEVKIGTRFIYMYGKKPYNVEAIAIDTNTATFLTIDEHSKWSIKLRQCEFSSCLTLNDSPDKKEIWHPVTVGVCIGILYRRKDEMYFGIVKEVGDCIGVLFENGTYESYPKQIFSRAAHQKGYWWYVSEVALHNMDESEYEPDEFDSLLDFEDVDFADVDKVFDVALDFVDFFEKWSDVK